MPRQYLTIDTLVSLLTLPWQITCSLPLIALAVNPTFSSRAFLSTLVFALTTTALSYLSILNSRIAHGGARNIDWADEVVVITGGANGLGRLIAETYGMRGARVAVLDVVEPEGLERVKWWKCDVGDLEAVRAARREIEMDFGVPTILINNAGVVNGLPLLELPAAAIERNFRINLLSHYFTIQTFLPAMLERPSGGTIVTVASVLGHLGASKLSDYTAAKAGLIAMHASLRAELASMASAQDPPPGARNIRTVLIKPGQLSTQMFGSMQTPSQFFGPVVEAVDLAKAIVKAVDSGKSSVIAMPLYAQYIEWLGVLPAGLQRIARAVSGVDTAMEHFARPSDKGSRSAHK